MLLIFQEAVDIALKVYSTKSVLTRIGIVVPMLTEHCKGLSGASLAISENGRIEAPCYFKYTIYTCQDQKDC